MTWVAYCNGPGSPSGALPSGPALDVDVSAIDGPETPSWTYVGGPAPSLVGGQPTLPRVPSPPTSLLPARTRASPSSLCAAVGEPELSSLVVGQPRAEPPLEQEHSPPPARFLKVYYRRRRRVQLAELGASAGADVALEASARALAVSAGAPLSASPTYSRAWADVIAVLLVSEDAPLNGAITPLQQSFLD
jgi:hypothetical protein